METTTVRGTTSTASDRTTDALTELIVINNDRYEGYQTAANETDDAELKSLFNRFSNQSQGFGEELRRLLPLSETPKRDETKLSGKFYRAWMDVKSALTGKNKKSILSSCEFGEDVALKTYNDVLDNQKDIPADLLTVVRRQRDELQLAHDQVKTMRDAA